MGLKWVWCGDEFIWDGDWLVKVGRDGAVKDINGPEETIA